MVAGAALRAAVFFAFAMGGLILMVQIATIAGQGGPTLTDWLVVTWLVSVIATAAFAWPRLGRGSR